MNVLTKEELLELGYLCRKLGLQLARGPDGGVVIELKEEWYG